MANLLLVTSNGTGMGHLTRQAAVALTLGTDDHSTIFSLSLGLPLARGLGIPGEYCPSYDRPWIASRNWNSYLRDRLVAIAREIAADAVLFDGVAPYPGLAHAATAMRDVAFIWLRRGMWKEANVRALTKGRFFDLVIEPGDLASEDDTGPTASLTDASKVSPISILEPLGLLPRDEARRMLGLPLDEPIALVTLGSGRLGDVAGPGTTALGTLLDAPEWHIAVTRSPVALNDIPIDRMARMTLLSGVYPLAIFLSAFDLAISSAGYNAVHELIPAGVPSLMVANTSTRTDDQTARAASLERQGLALSARDDDLDSVAAKAGSLLDERTRRDLGDRAAATMERMTGASETGDTAIRFADGFETRTRSPSQLIAGGVQRAKDIVRGVLGDERTEAVKKALGRTPTPVHQRATVSVTDRTGGTGPPLELAVVRAVSGEELRLDQPIEDILETASDAYEGQRRAIINRYYDVTEVRRRRL